MNNLMNCRLVNELGFLFAINKKEITVSLPSDPTQTGIRSE